MTDDPTRNPEPVDDPDSDLPTHTDEELEAEEGNDAITEDPQP